MAAILLFVFNLLQTLIHFDGVFAQTLTPSSLYSADDYTVTLNSTNFDQIIYNSNTSWLVQFYNSWCGHCIKFSPVWKQLAADINNWSDLIQLGVINCAHPNNTQTCRDHSIKTYPTVRFFRAKTNKSDSAVEFRPSNRQSMSQVQQELMGFLENLTSSTSIDPTVMGRIDGWPVLKAVQSMAQLPSTKHNQSHVLVVEDESSVHGRILIMDLHNETSSLTVSRILNRDYPDKSTGGATFQLLDISQPQYANPISTLSTTRQGIYDSIRTFYASREHQIPDLTLRNISEEVSESRKQTEANRNLVHRLFRNDLEAALFFSLTRDIAQKSSIQGEALDALVSYIQVINDYFPFASVNDTFTKYLTFDLRTRISLTGDEFQEWLNHYGSTFLQKPKEWMGCKGSRPDRRGFTCGLWMVFHTLTVRRYMSPNQNMNEARIRNAITGYVRHFFGCSECAKHFLQMAETIEGNNASGGADEVMWLWKAHNKVNLRLVADYTEDPAFPKSLFPHSQICTGCYFINGTWNEQHVLHFLVDMYSNVQESSSASWLSYIASDNSTSSASRIYISLYFLMVSFVAVCLIKSFKREREPNLRTN